MRSLKLFYWLLTVVAAGIMILSAIPDVISHPEAVKIFIHLGYPAYLLPFLGVAKLLGAVIVLTPRQLRLKDWAYAGLTFDTAGAAYSHLCSGDGVGNWGFALVAMLLVLSSFYLYVRFYSSRKLTAALD